ncbi:UDP-2,3-diacylglucosamine hydrolase [Lunatimonas lonarensis]|uniref:UDP-2,3-diacylglucosamine hydrolase n=1 Tax=Lunatimonas lonarensis TaxID=1232681 RepID=R7ZL16_9BACT|nr:UDP-2,3-diacylglucosamine diphosphatase [Lunatimonas lonarensis]EON74785.1 UDP-2,3-diacylglucosamine hydrolase [Lunatimonas lonarensis]
MNITLKENQKIFFASDFHLGTPSASSSLDREKKIIRWLELIEKEAAAVFLLGDLFDFWFEYDTVIPKGYLRFLSKITQMRQQGVPVFFFTGNHDLWMKDYFTQELDIPVFHNPISLQVNQKKFLIGHGDGLGPGDNTYKVLKKIFTNRSCQWLFKWLHPDVGIRLATRWSKRSRINNSLKGEDEFKGKESEWLYLYCLDMEKKMHFDYYVFGHRHLPLSIPVGNSSMYFNLGEWVSQYHYGVFNGHGFQLINFKG